jgi:hypothetical protein
MYPREGAPASYEDHDLQEVMPGTATGNFGPKPADSCLFALKFGKLDKQLSSIHRK